MIFTKETYTDVFDGYIIKDCSIRHPLRQIYLLVEDNDEKIKNGYLPDYWFVYTFNEQEDPMDRFYASNRTDMNGPKITYNAKFNETLGLDILGQINSHSDGDREEED